MVQRESIQEGAEDEQTHKGPKLFPRGRQKPPVQAASIHEADLRAREARNPAPERLPAGLGAVEFQRGFGSHKRRPHLPGSAINHVALIRMPVAELRGARRHSRLGLWASDAAHRSRAAASRPVRPGVDATARSQCCSWTDASPPGRDGLARCEESRPCRRPAGEGRLWLPAPQLRPWNVRLCRGLRFLHLQNRPVTLTLEEPGVQAGREVGR